MNTTILVIEDSLPINELICINLETAGYEAVPFFDGDEAAVYLDGLSRDFSALPSDNKNSASSCTLSQDFTTSAPDIRNSSGSVTALKQNDAVHSGKVPAPSAQRLPSLALLDIMLPGQDGFALLPKCTELGIPVIFLTARGDLTSKVHGLQGGAEDYIVKPFEMLELLVRVENVLKRHQPAEDVLRIRDVEIFPKERIVKKNGVEIPFKPMEFDCLLLLCKYKNIAISRQQLLHALWGIDFEGETRTIDVHIARIRKKLDFQDVIKTIRLIGYRLEDHS